MRASELRLGKTDTLAHQARDLLVGVTLYVVQDHDDALLRGEAMKDIDQVVETIIKMSAIIESCQTITDIEINPLMVYEQGQGVKAVDVRILVSKTA